MKINKVTLENEDYLTNLEIYGSCNNQEAMQLEKIAKKYVSLFGVIGKRFVDINGYHGYQSCLADARIKYTKNNNLGNNQLDFHFDYRGVRIKRFLNSFQRKFGKIDESKIEYEK